MKKLVLKMNVAIATTINIAIFFVLFTNVLAQGPTIQWQRSIGGTDADVGNSLSITADGGLVIAGFSSSPDLPNYHGGKDFLVARLTFNGDTLWVKTFGGSNDDVAFSIKQTMDHGFITCGYTLSTDGDISFNNGSADYWVIKLDSLGNLEWEQSFGGSNDDKAHDIEQTNDSCYVMTGYTNSTNGDIDSANCHGSLDIWVIKFCSTSNTQWQKMLGGNEDDQGFSIECNDNSYVITGYSQSDDGNVTEQFGGGDLWIFKLAFHTSSQEELSNLLDLKIYPNPFRDFINIDVGNEKIADIKLINMLGQVVLEKNFGTQQNEDVKLIFKTEIIPAGIYLIQVSTKNYVLSKIVVHN